MPLRRTLRGREVKRTRRLGNNIRVILRSEPGGSPGPRLLLPLAEVRVTLEPRQPAPPPP